MNMKNKANEMKAKSFYYQQEGKTREREKRKNNICN